MTTTTTTIEFYENGQLVSSQEVDIPAPPLLGRLNAKFEAIPREGIDPAIRAHFRLLQAGVNASLKAPVPDVEAAKAAIDNAKMPDGSNLPQELAAIQGTLLDEPEFEA